MGKMSREKGKRGEREWAEELRNGGFEARRGVQYQGGPGSPDVVSNVLDVHFEVKRTETFQPYAALEQAASEAKPGETPVVAHRRNGKPWIVVMYVADWIKEQAY